MVIRIKYDEDGKPILLSKNLAEKKNVVDLTWKVIVAISRVAYFTCVAQPLAFSIAARRSLSMKLKGLVYFKS